MADAAPFEIVDGTELPVDEVLSILTSGYGRPFLPDWFAWKHTESPWGPSRIHVARDPEGSLGVVFGLPWQLTVNGQTMNGVRLVDGATTPRAVRRGVFRQTVRAELNQWSTERPAVVIATATPEARDAHVKNGAVALDPIDYFYRPVHPHPGAVDIDESVLDTFVPGVPAGRWTTNWDRQSLRWRIDPRSGNEHQVASLRSADTPNGAVYRVSAQKGLRTLVIPVIWGALADRARLLRAIAWECRAVAMLAPMGPGCELTRPRFALARGRSLLCIWDIGGSEGSTASPTRRQQWALRGVDLDGAI